jgi:hypothetical protein
MPVRTVLPAAVLLVALLLPVHAGASGTTGRVAVVLPSTATVYTHPSNHAPVLAVLVQQTEVSVLHALKAWDQVKVWGSVKGWVPKSAIGFRAPWRTQSTYKAPAVHYRVTAHGPRSLPTTAVSTGTLMLLGKPGGRERASLPSGATVTVSAWQQDAHGLVWYEVNRLWTSGPLLFRLSPVPFGAWKAIAGKGMWLTLGTAGDSSADAIARAAHADGVTHLYVEAAISPWGFHGKSTVGPLIEAAHRRHIAVIAWVYPYLDDIASDVDLTRQVAAFRTPNGDGFDGIAADLERNMDITHIRTYSQLIRRYLGPSALLIGVTYPPQSIPTYPFAEVARVYNAIAPMDYWHQTRTDRGLDYGHMRYGYAYAYRYAQDSVHTIRQVSGAVPILPIGQTFDDFGKLEMGPDAPSQAEVRGFLQGSKDSGAGGASFFQWMSTTVPEWRAIRAFRF